MKPHFFAVLLSAILATASTTRAADEPEAPSIRLDPIGGWVLASDNATLILSVPSKGELVFIDTTAGQEMRRVRVGFQPTALALQGQTLFAAAHGSGVVYALDLQTGKEKQRFPLPGEPVRALACYPAGGPIFAANLNEEVLAIDPKAATVTKTAARGRFLAVDPRQGAFLYTGTSRPDEEEYVEVKRGPDKTLRLRFVTVRGAAALRKYAVQGTDLKLVAGNANAALGAGSVLVVSPDGKRVALVAHDGWRSAKEERARGVIAVFSTENLTTMLGQVETGSPPQNLAFHPSRNLGAALTDNARLSFFDTTSMTQRPALRLQNLPHRSWLDLLTFAGKGTRLVVLQGETLTFLPLEPAGAGQAVQGKAPGTPPAKQPLEAADSKGAVRSPVVIKDKKSLWLLEPLTEGMAFQSDRDYAILKFPAEMAGSTALVRAWEDVLQGGIGSGRLTALEDGTVYAAIMYEYNGAVRLSKLGFHKLATEGWEPVEGKFETSEPGNEIWRWKVVKRPLPKGNVYLNLKIPPAHTVFFFKPASAAPKAAPAGEGLPRVPAAKAPTRAPVVLKNKKSLWLLEPLTEGMAFLSDRDYAILKFPAEMAGCTVLVRTSEDVVQGGIGSGQLTALQDGTIYAAIVYEYNREVRLSKVGFRKLATEGWEPVPGDFRTTDVGNEDWQWKVVKKPLEKGNVYVNLKIPGTHTIFFFKPAQGKAPPAEAEGPSGDAALPAVPVRSPVVLKDKQSLWLLEPLAEGMAFLSDRDYALLKFPREMAGSTVLLRTSQEAGRGELPSGQLTALEEGTVYAAIMYEYNGQVRVSPAAFRLLESNDWEVVGSLQTVEPGNESWKWKVVKRRLRKGNVYLELKIPPAQTIFFFKAGGRPQAGAPAKEERAAAEVLSTTSSAR